MDLIRAVREISEFPSAATTSAASIRWSRPRPERVDRRGAHRRRDARRVRACGSRHRDHLLRQIVRGAQARVRAGVAILAGGEATRLRGKLELAGRRGPARAARLTQRPPGRETVVACKGSFRGRPGRAARRFRSSSTAGRAAVRWPDFSPPSPRSERCAFSRSRRRSVRRRRVHAALEDAWREGDEAVVPVGVPPAARNSSRSARCTNGSRFCAKALPCCARKAARCAHFSAAYAPARFRSRTRSPSATSTPPNSIRRCAPSSPRSSDEFRTESVRLHPRQSRHAGRRQLARTCLQGGRREPAVREVGARLHPHRPRRQRLHRLRHVLGATGARARASRRGQGGTSGGRPRNVLRRADRSGERTRRTRLRDGPVG